MLQRIKLLSEAYQVVRPVSLSVIAIAVASLAMAMVGWHGASFALGCVIVAIAVVLVFQVHRAVGHLRRESVVIHRASLKAERHYVDVLRRIIRFVECHQGYARGRSRRVGDLAEQIARRLSLPEEKCRMLNLAGQLRDIGLLAISEKILSKPSRLGVHEFRDVQKHSKASYEILKPLKSLREILPAIQYHHERMNGTGYPFGLAGDEIPVGARILAAADAYDAMTHDRPYRQAISPLEAMREMRRCSPAGYDEACVNALAAVTNLPELEEAMVADG
ncbi:MAG: HD domain-containing phosphohydrolase [Planctomycetota bacterium]|nr:HD domain-containing phosphohydrolase [Planctomycetota bacterium]